ncbi:MAG: DUF3991 domain-containing protein [Lachnospiraceae bacterium]|nr:DUF3991 domain-containing protein [Lachnospiraceae bacterium]
MAGQLKRFTDEQIERAGRVDVVEYARSQGIGIKKSGLWYKAQNMGGLYFHRGANTWHWETQDTGGKGAISLCMKLENKTWVEAVKTLLGEDMEPIRHTQDWKPEPEPPREFRLPDKNDTYRHVFAYLVKTRGIDSGILKEMVDKGYVYENTQKSCVFLGRDKEGTAKHASVRSTNTHGKAFKQDVAGSQKAFSFSLSGTSGTLNVFEAPIDVLSYMSLQKVYGKQTNDSYVALGGVTDKALERFLKEYPDIEKIRVCTDNDQAGEKAASRFFESYKEKYKVTRHRPTHKDFNEDLVAYRVQERSQDKKEIREQSSVEQQEKITKEQQEPDQPNVQQRQENVPEDFSIKGSCEILVLCDDKEDIQAYRDISVRNYKAEFNMDYEPNEYYLAYRDTGQVQSFVENNPDIKKLWICTGRTAEGIQRANDIIKAFGHKMECYREKPKLCRFTEDLAEMNRLEPVLEQSLRNAPQMEAAVGMEM